jgi:hypothetical protein
MYDLLRHSVKKNFVTPSAWQMALIVTSRDMYLPLSGA